jgi:hypothetical protein
MERARVPVDAAGDPLRIDTSVGGYRNLQVGDGNVGSTASNLGGNAAGISGGGDSVGAQQQQYNALDDPFATDSETPKEEDALAPGHTTTTTTRQSGFLPSYYLARHDDDYDVQAGATASQQSLVRSFLGKSTGNSVYEGVGSDSSTGGGGGGGYFEDEEEMGLTEGRRRMGGASSSSTAIGSVDSLRLDRGAAPSSPIDHERTIHTAKSSSTNSRSHTTSSKRASARYSLTPTPASRLRSVTKSLRRASMRVVNLAAVGLEEREREREWARGVRLPDGEERDEDGKAGARTGRKGKGRGRDVERSGFGEEDGDGEDEDEEGDEEGGVLDLARRLPIRGRTLGVFGPTSRVRLAMFRFLTHTYVFSWLLVLSMSNEGADNIHVSFVHANRWTEPTILVLIIVNAVVLTIQAARHIDSETAPEDIPTRGYFHRWEDYALFSLFILFT